MLDALPEVHGETVPRVGMTQTALELIEHLQQVHGPLPGFCSRAPLAWGSAQRWWPARRVRDAWIPRALSRVSRSSS